MSLKIINCFPNEILNESEGPFISLYQPTHRHNPDNKQDIIRFKNLLKDIENSLEKGYPKKQISTMLKPFYDLAENRPFWNQTLDGLAVLATKDRGVIYKLQRPVKELAVVADSFHIKPLIRIFQSADRYQLLGLNRNEFVLYEGNRYGFAEVEFETGTPRTIEEILGKEYTDKHLIAGAYAGVEGFGAFHGHGSKKDETDKYTSKFFRHVDRFILENYSRPSGLPLILVSLTEYHSLFQNLSHNPFLMKDGIKIAFDALTIEGLKDKFWENIERLYLDKTQKLVDSFEVARAKFLATDDLVQIVRAVWEKKVDTLFIESDKIISGKVDLTTGELIRGDLEHPEFGDVIDDLAEMVFNYKGEVVALPKERMPTKTGIAAIFKY